MYVIYANFLCKNWGMHMAPGSDMCTSLIAHHLLRQLYNASVPNPTSIYIA